MSESKDTSINDQGDPMIFDGVAYVPYLAQLSRAGAKKHRRWRATFQGGEIELTLPRLNAVMIYGVSGDVPVEFLSDASDERVNVVFHTRHKKTPLSLLPRPRADRHDILTAQIKARESPRKRVVIAKALVTARVRQMGWLISSADDELARIRQCDDIASVRVIEAEYARIYWRKYFQALDLNGERRDDNPVAQALDALSSFTAPLLMRGIVQHGLSPNHGYLHEPSDYEALVYDLMEPVRHWTEQAVFEQYRKHGEQGLTANAIKAYQAMLDARVEVPSLQVAAKRKHVLYSMVLALRDYLLGGVNHVHLPLDSLERSRGRPVKVNYRIPGAIKRLR